MNIISNSSQSEGIKKLMLILIISIFVFLSFLSLWGNISELFYPYAYESIAYSYSAYFIIQLHKNATKGHANINKLKVMAIAFSMQIMPLVYLVITKQLNVDDAFGGKFDHTLVHLQYSNLLPFVALSILLLPIKTANQSKQSKRSENLIF